MKKRGRVPSRGRSRAVSGHAQGLEQVGHAHQVQPPPQMIPPRAQTELRPHFGQPPQPDARLLSLILGGAGAVKKSEKVFTRSVKPALHHQFCRSRGHETHFNSSFQIFSQRLLTSSPTISATLSLTQPPFQTWRECFFLTGSNKVVSTASNDHLRGGQSEL